jgi:hypothetical protein
VDISSSVLSRPPGSEPKQTSLFVDGRFPRRRAVVVLVSLLGGIFVAYAWSAKLADDQIGFNSADAMLGHSATGTPIGGLLSGVLFAFITGLAGSFTACNIVCFGAVGPLLGQTRTATGRMRQTLRPLGWMATGMIPVSAAYGALVGIVGTRMPQFAASSGHGLSPRAIQSMTAFGLVGAVMIVLGLASAGVIKDPLGPISRRFPNAPLILMGALIGGFLIGRPYPLFHAMFVYAANRHNPLFGALAFSLQSIGNIIVMSLVFLILAVVFGGPVGRWLAAKPSRISVLTAAAFIVAGAFSVTYWDVRVLHSAGYIWFPTAPSWG